jgi:hypothetical protein
MTSSEEADVDTPDRPQPSKKEVARIIESGERWSDRRQPVGVTFKEIGGKFGVQGNHSDDSGFAMRLGDAFGSRSHEFIGAQLMALEIVSRPRCQTQSVENDPASLNASLAIVEAVRPENEIEAALAVQMAQGHMLTTELMGLARHADDTERLQIYANLAIKMQRTFTTQIEALARLRGKGQQTVRVEHVTVEAGGQAIVGDIHQHGRAPTAKPQEQANAGSTADSTVVRRPALRSPDPLGPPMPGPGDAERSLSHARRAEPRRTRKSERAQARSPHARDERASAPIQ